MDTNRLSSARGSWPLPICDCTVGAGDEPGEPEAPISMSPDLDSCGCAANRTTRLRTSGSSDCLLGDVHIRLSLVYRLTIGLLCAGSRCDVSSDSARYIGFPEKVEFGNRRVVGKAPTAPPRLKTGVEAGATYSTSDRRFCRYLELSKVEVVLMCCLTFERMLTAEPKKMYPCREMVATLEHGGGNNSNDTHKHTRQ